MKKLIVVCFLLAGFIFPGRSFAGTITEEWVVKYGGPANFFDEASAIAVDHSGGVYVTGSSSASDEWRDSDYATIKYDTDGNELWTARYNGPGDLSDTALAMAVDDFGNVFVTGWSIGYRTDWDYATIKYDGITGEQLWVARYNNDLINSTDFANAIAIDTAGNIYVTGGSESSENPGPDYVTIKYDTDGNELWVARYDGPDNHFDEASALAVDSLGNVYVTGYSFGNGTGEDYATIKYDTDGNELWVARYNSIPEDSFSDFAIAIAVDTLGNVYVTGESFGYTQWDYATVKYNGTSGNQEWVKRYDGSINNHDYATAMAVDPSGDVYVTGWSDNYLTTIKYATNDGTLLWKTRYGGPGSGSDIPTAMAIDSSGDNVYVTGNSRGDYVTIMYDTNNGNELLAARYNGPTNSPDYICAIALSDCGNVYVTGYSRDSSGTGWEDYDYVTIKYSQSPAAAIEDLIATVESFNLPQGITKSLTTKLQNAIKALNAPNADQRQDAINKLQAFINEVNAQRGRGLTNEQADILINGLDKIICLLS